MIPKTKVLAHYEATREYHAERADIGRWLLRHNLTIVEFTFWIDVWDALEDYCWNEQTS
jgi:hypothetical protein